MEKQNLPYRVVRTNRRTVAVQITPAGDVVVRCPRRMPDKDIRGFVESKSRWIEKHLEKQSTAAQLPVFTDEQLQDLVRQARQVIPERAAYFANLLGVSYGRITIRCQRTLWGSCSSEGNLNFNCLLMLTPPQVLDYVVIHELCHRKEMNHSARFWAEVERILPDYNTRRKWLKENGTSLIGRLPG